MMTRRFLAFALLSALLVSCAAPPPFEEPDLGTEIPPHFTSLSTGAETANDGDSGVRWWTSFGDERLDRLVLEAVAENRDLRVAAARVHGAAAQARITGADAVPQIGLRYDGAREKRNFIGLPIPGVNGPLSNRFTMHGVSLDVSWEVDVWGRLQAGRSASLADRQAALADLHAASLSLVGQTSKAWFAVVESQRQVELASSAVEKYRETSRRVSDRYERGLRPSLDVRLADANLSAAQARLEERRAVRDRAARQLEILLGRYPAGVVESPGDLPSLSASIPAGLPARLLTRRPDLAALERRLSAAGARVEAAKKALYPRFGLTAAGGSSSRELEGLVDGDFSVWRIAGNILQPVFQGGRLLAGVDLAQARQRESLAAYVGAALGAFAEVETALASERFLAGREAALRRQVEQARAAESLALDRYGRGLESIVTLLSAQLQAVQAESGLLFVRRLRLDNRVDLHLALGGGFRRDIALSERSDGDEGPNAPSHENTTDDPQERTSS